jgi:hypothetical protein
MLPSCELLGVYERPVNDTSKLGEGDRERDELSDLVMVWVMVVERNDAERSLDVVTDSEGNLESDGVADCVWDPLVRDSVTDAEGLGDVDTEGVGLPADPEGVWVLSLLCVFPLADSEKDFDAFVLSREALRLKVVDNEFVCSIDGDDVRDGDIDPTATPVPELWAVNEKLSDMESLGEGDCDRLLSRERLFDGVGVSAEFVMETLSSGGLRV